MVATGSVARAVGMLAKQLVEGVIVIAPSNAANGITLDAISPLAKTIPESLFMIYQMTFAIITVALVAGSVADRLLSGCCWSTCRLRIGSGAAASWRRWASWISPVGSSCI